MNVINFPWDKCAFIARRFLCCPAYRRGKGAWNGLRALSCAISGCRAGAKARGSDAEGRHAMCDDWNRPVEHLCRDDAPSAEFNGAHTDIWLSMSLKSSMGNTKLWDCFQHGTQIKDAQLVRFQMKTTIMLAKSTQLVPFPKVSWKQTHSWFSAQKVLHRIVDFKAWKWFQVV